ncbi:unnamed protein product [Adineta steineri]|uniref:Uncharacterized protein n=1 Tax=Adineta steineri TaxID=433720 RepID=A0A815W9M0_9BILA|nr:unnamed protein product [Adineta steineri]CAF1542061.1 unnamed protein product [Adineta steineri]
MASSTSSSTTFNNGNIVNDEKFVQIYTPNETAIQSLDNERTVMNVTPGLCGCALGIHSYSSGIHHIRIRVDHGNPVLGIHSRNIPLMPDDYCWGTYSTSPSTYGWLKDRGRVLNGKWDKDKQQTMPHFVCPGCNSRCDTKHNDDCDRRDPPVDYTYVSVREIDTRPQCQKCGFPVGDRRPVRYYCGKCGRLYCYACCFK